MLMADSSVVNFSDPDAFHVALGYGRVQGAITARGDFRAELTRVDLHRLFLYRSEETLPRVAYSALDPTLSAILFATSPSQPPIRNRGLELPSDEIIVHRAGCEGHNRSAGASQWSFLSLRHDDLAAAGEALLGRELTAPALTQRIRPPAPLLARLSNLHEAAAHLAKTAPDILAQSEVVRALEQGLMQAMVACMSSSEVGETRSAYHRHAAAMRRVEEVLEVNSDRTLYLAELCAAVGISERTLRECCQEHLGMSLIRYLWLRRMHLARRGLRTFDPSTTVTEIATRYGFWELGRFAVAYRSLFGESPSASLRRPREDPRPRKNFASPWNFPEFA